MEPERWRRIEQLYHSALKVAADKRARFLQTECGSDEALREEIESLLSYESSAAGFIESPAFDVVAKQIVQDTADEQVPTATIGARLPRFRILEKLGTGEVPRLLYQSQCKFSVDDSAGMRSGAGDGV